LKALTRSDAIAVLKRAPHSHRWGLAWAFVSAPRPGDGKPLAVPTVTHLHAVLPKALRDAVLVDELISSNPWNAPSGPGRKPSNQERSGLWAKRPFP
jgi:hypothetical protein